MNADLRAVVMRQVVLGMDSFRRAALAATVIAVAVMAATPAAAEAAYCRQLQAEYLSADRIAVRDGGDTGQLRRDLARTQEQARRLGCQRFLFFGPKPSKQCPAIMTRLNQLQRQVNQAGGFGWGNVNQRQASYQRDRLRDTLLRNGCEVPSRSGWAGSGYRTLCVRTCDGYYFPISFSTGRSRFKIDESVCKAMYGGAEAELYVHNNGSPSELAVSLAGQPYLSLPSALAYRSSFSGSCQAELHAGLGALAAAQEVALAQAEAQQEADRRADPAGSLVPIPVARVQSGEDPETIANRIGNFRVEPVVADEEDGSIDTVADAGGAVIRRLGPDYYYKPPVTLDGLKREPWKAPDLSFVGTARANDGQPPGSEASETSVQ